MLSQITSVVSVTSAFQSPFLFRPGFHIISNVAITNIRLRNDELLDMELPKF